VGVELSGSNARMLNAGLISSDSSGIRIAGDDHGISNTGQIISGASAIFIDGGGNKVSNRGILTSTSSGSSAGIYVISGAGETTRITNSGEINANDLAISCGLGIDIITNRGRIDGHVSLGSGNDIFDGRSGQVLGEIRGGLGDDIYRIWDASTVLVEAADAGLDTVEIEGSLRLAANFENLTLLGMSGWAGTGNGLDNVITGNAQNNRLLGGGGSDSLKGGAGIDVLIGGAGRDYLWGSEDADQFLFRTVGESSAAAPDRIRDFVSGEDVIDLRAIDAVAGGDTNNTFDFIGTAAFSGMAGELRIVNGDTSRAEADVNGDGNADFMLMFTNGVRLHAWDFVL
jgi:Ca2+-binding RTX toxin-like protein